MPKTEPDPAQAVVYIHKTQDKEKKDSFIPFKA